MQHNKKPLIFFTPVDDITKAIMEDTFKELGVPASFSKIDATGKASYGAVRNFKITILYTF